MKQKIGTAIVFSFILKICKKSQSWVGGSHFLREQWAQWQLLYVLGKAKLDLWRAGTIKYYCKAKKQVPKVVTCHSDDNFKDGQFLSYLPSFLFGYCSDISRIWSPEWWRGRMKEEESERLPSLVLGHTRSQNNKKHLIYRCHHLSSLCLINLRGSIDYHYHYGWGRKAVTDPWQTDRQVKGKKNWLVARLSRHYIISLLSLT